MVTEKGTLNSSSLCCPKLAHHFLRSWATSTGSLWFWRTFCQLREGICRSFSDKDARTLFITDAKNEVKLQRWQKLPELTCGLGFLCVLVFFLVYYLLIIVIRGLAEGTYPWDEAHLLDLCMHNCTVHNFSTVYAILPHNLSFSLPEEHCITSVLHT